MDTLPATEHQSKSIHPFAGFALPISNTTYCPNQFFDVCLRHGSRGCVRLVAYLIRKTLGWCDRQGNPQQTQIRVSYRQLVEEANISRQMIRPVLDEALAGHFIRCVRQPQAKAAGQPAVTALYELAWDEGEAYIKDPARFRGFFAGNGNRTYIPNQFFDELIPQETLAVIKTVGAVIRFSIGFQTRFGFRRQEAALSYQDLLRYSSLNDRKTLAAALRHAQAVNYIRQVEAGIFDPQGGRQSRPATYSLKWLSEAVATPVGAKTPPADPPARAVAQNPTDIGQNSLPADEFQNPTGLQITEANNTFQKQGLADSSKKEEAIRLLRQAGFDSQAARQIAERYPLSRIQRQIGWLPLRRPRRNRLGLLRMAIAEDWPRPDSSSGPGGRTGNEPLADARQLQVQEALARLTRQFTL